MLSTFKLSRMKKTELLKVAEQLGCQIEPGTKRPEVIEAIQAKQGSGAELPQVADSREPGNRELFESLTQSGAADAETNTPGEPSGDPFPDSPGPGRPKGKTNEECLIDALPTRPNKTVEWGLKYIFKIWAKVANCPSIELDETELKEYATDTTQFLHYHGILIPQGLCVDTKFVLGGLELIGQRVMITKAHKERMRRLAEKENQPQETANNAG